MVYDVPKIIAIVHRHNHDFCKINNEKLFLHLGWRPTPAAWVYCFPAIPNEPETTNRKSGRAQLPIMQSMWHIKPGTKPLACWRLVNSSTI